MAAHLRSSILFIPDSVFKVSVQCACNFQNSLETRICSKSMLPGVSAVFVLGEVFSPPAKLVSGDN